MDRRKFLKVVGMGIMGLAVAPLLPKIGDEKDYETSLGAEQFFAPIKLANGTSGFIGVATEDVKKWSAVQVATIGQVKIRTL